MNLHDKHAFLNINVCVIGMKTLSESESKLKIPLLEKYCIAFHAKRIYIYEEIERYKLRERKKNPEYCNRRC